MAIQYNRQKRAAKRRFEIASSLEMEYTHQLRTLTRHIDHLIKLLINVEMSEQEIKSSSERIEWLLNDYAKAINPWANATAEKIIQRVHKVNETEWIQLGRLMGRELRKELNEAPTGNVTRIFLSEQVRLITSLPLEAAKRVHELTLEAITEGARADEIAGRILETGRITEKRAVLIARTEIARTASALTIARSESIGCTHYYWRTSRDSNVRDSHKKMDGKIIAFNDPPKVDEKVEPYHAGCIWNCRCYIEPILDDLQ